MVSRTSFPSFQPWVSRKNTNVPGRFLSRVSPRKPVLIAKGHTGHGSETTSCLGARPSLLHNLQPRTHSLCTRPRGSGSPPHRDMRPCGGQDAVNRVRKGTGELLVTTCVADDKDREAGVMTRDRGRHTPTTKTLRSPFRLAALHDALRWRRQGLGQHAVGTRSGPTPALGDRST